MTNTLLDRIRAFRASLAAYDIKTMQDDDSSLRQLLDDCDRDIDMLADVLHRIVVAICDVSDDWTGSVGDAIDLLNARIIDLDRALTPAAAKTFKPDHNGECLHCDEPGDAHLCPPEDVRLIARIEKLPAYQPDSWGQMVEGDTEDARFFPAKVWIKRDAVLKLLRGVRTTR